MYERIEPLAVLGIVALTLVTLATPAAAAATVQDSSNDGSATTEAGVTITASVVTDGVELDVEADADASVIVHVDSVTNVNSGEGSYVIESERSMLVSGAGTLAFLVTVEVDEEVVDRTLIVDSGRCDEYERSKPDQATVTAGSDDVALLSTTVDCPAIPEYDGFEAINESDDGYEGGPDDGSQDGDEQEDDESQDEEEGEDDSERENDGNDESENDGNEDGGTITGTLVSWASDARDGVTDSYESARGTLLGGYEGLRSTINDEWDSGSDGAEEELEETRDDANTVRNNTENDADRIVGNTESDAERFADDSAELAGNQSAALRDELRALLDEEVTLEEILRDGTNLTALVEENVTFEDVLAEGVAPRDVLDEDVEGEIRIEVRTESAGEVTVPIGTVETDSETSVESETDVTVEDSGETSGSVRTNSSVETGVVLDAGDESND